MAPPITNLTVGWSPGLNSVETQVKALIQSAEANIERLTVQIRELTCIREKERGVLATLRLMVVPIGKLPTELLAEIFKIAVETPVIHPWIRTHEDPDFLGPLYWGDPYTGLRKVLRLSQVSSYWRQIVHNTPQLWAEGVVDVKWDRKLTDPYLSRLKTLVTRSTPYPISVSLTRDPDASKNRASFSETLKHVASIMVPTTRRWKNLELDMDSFGHFNGLPPGSFEALERLQISGFSEQIGEVTAFSTSPRLQQFTLRAREQSRLRLIQLPWQQLTHLNVEDGSLGAVRDALLQCTNLIWTKIKTPIAWDLSAEAADSPIVTLPFLATLFMTMHGSDSHTMGGLEAFFAPFSLPSLTTINLNFANCDDLEVFWPTDVFSEFQSRAPKIEKIDLQFSPIDSDGLAALLQHAPSLTALTAEFALQCNAHDFFDALRYDTSDPTPLAPNLQDIDLWCTFDFDEDAVEEAIRSRWWKDGEEVLPDGSPRAVARLKSVIVSRDDSGKISRRFKTRTQDLVEQGLELRVSKYY
ncbi:hypothetical protein DFH06DRAFT_1158918 [Mycena polygramma]|nr:hypothetical protein DFH06DRAFT_1158918 [Mycena polygramma]